MENVSNAEDDVSDEEVIERWLDHGRRINAALEETDYDLVAALIDDRGKLMPLLEGLASRLSDDQRSELLDSEDDLQELMREHHEYIKKKLVGVGRMRLGVRKYNK
jgi:hypothetical protein